MPIFSYGINELPYNNFLLYGDQSWKIKETKTPKKISSLQLYKKQYNTDRKYKSLNALDFSKKVSKKSDSILSNNSTPNKNSSLQLSNSYKKRVFFPLDSSKKISKKQDSILSNNSSINSTKFNNKRIIKSRFTAGTNKTKKKYKLINIKKYGGCNANSKIDNILNELYLADAVHDFKKNEHTLNYTRNLKQKNVTIQELSYTLESEIFYKVLNSINDCDNSILTNLYFLSTKTPNTITNYFGRNVSNNIVDFKDYLNIDLDLDYSKKIINDGSLTNLKSGDNKLHGWIKGFLNERDNFITAETIYDSMGVDKQEVRLDKLNKYSRPDLLSLCDISDKIFNNTTANKSTAFNEKTVKMFNIVYYIKEDNTVSVALLFKKNVDTQNIIPGGSKKPKKKSTATSTTTSTSTSTATSTAKSKAKSKAKSSSQTNIFIKLEKNPSDNLYKIYNSTNAASSSVPIIFDAIDIEDNITNFSPNIIAEMFKYIDDPTTKVNNKIMLHIIKYLKNHINNSNDTIRDILLDLKKAGDYGKVQLGNYYNLEKDNKLILLSNDALCALHGILKLNIDVITAVSDHVGNDSRQLIIYTTNDIEITDYYEYFKKRIINAFQINSVDAIQFEIADKTINAANFETFFSIIEKIIFEKINNITNIYITMDTIIKELINFIKSRIYSSWYLIIEILNNTSIDNSSRIKTINRYISECNYIYVNYFIYNISKTDVFDKIIIFNKKSINSDILYKISGIDEIYNNHRINVINASIKNINMDNLTKIDGNFIYGIIANNIIKHFLKKNIETIDILNLIKIYEKYYDYILKYKGVVNFYTNDLIKIYNEEFEKTRGVLYSVVTYINFLNYFLNKDNISQGIQDDAYQKKKNEVILKFKNKLYELFGGQSHNSYNNPDILFNVNKVYQSMLDTFETIISYYNKFNELNTNVIKEINLSNN